MKRRTFTKLLGAAGAAPAAMPAPEAGATAYRSPSPFDVGTRAQLFADRVLVRETAGISFTLHPAGKHPLNPLVKADRPWEGWRLEIYGNVIYDRRERRFKMWYLGEAPNYYLPSAEGPSSDNPTLYATSSDGIHWEKPLVGTIPALHGGRHNAILAATHLASVIPDEQDPDPGKRYKMICYRHLPAAARGYHTMISADGIHWAPYSRLPICPGADVITGYFDEQRRQYVALAKIGMEIRGHRRRVFHTITSTDFENWTQPVLSLYPDLEDDAGSLARIEEVRPILDRPDDAALMRTEFYGMGFYPSESCTLGFAWVFTINNNARYGNQEGPFELQLAVSRDLMNWQRPFRTPCVPRGTIGEWDCGIFVTQSRALRVGDEIWLYYGGANYTHGTPCLYRREGTGRGTRYTGSIGLAKWKLDRFVSVDAGAEGGTLTTVPVVFSGDRLELNARTHPGGSIAVTLTDAAGRPIERFEQSEPFRGDALRQTIAWPGGRGPGSLTGKPVCLRFHLRAAELYSFAFRQA
ncbi:MAG TPA: hypothetical protein VFA33_20945 [Bryobacteraceae bacterium]|nr:hypothetical protein [Bryobacteraceae bacterium]